MAHCETVAREFYEFHLRAGTGPMVNPFPLARVRSGRRLHAHRNPMEPFRAERSGLYRPKVAVRRPRQIPEEKFSELFAALGSHRDRAAGHADINTTMGYKAVYPEEAINGHRAFLARRRALRPSGEYRLPTDEEWEELLGHFARRKVALGDCGRAYGTSCIHEHSCVRCPLLRPDPAQRPRLADLCDNLQARIGEAEHEGWLGEAEGLKVSLAAARQKLTQLDELARRRSAIHLGMPGFPDIASRTVTTPGQHS